MTKNFALKYVTVTSRKMNSSQMQWIGAVTMDGEYITEGRGTSRKKGQAADAEALICSGSLPDFAEFK
jgi:dsRNA-specific ribonuclease